tara:strand:+ start:2517 stop:3659 length:1143 start_codon:yes stop_codon:yes gene_type:complete
MNKEVNNVVYLVSSSLNLGGAEIQSVDLANQLSKRGFEVKFYSLKYDNILKNYLAKNVDLREFKIYSTKTKEKPTLGTFYWWLKAISQLRNEIRIDRKKNQNISVISFMYHSWVTSFLATLFLRNVKNIIAVRSSKIASRDKNTKLLRFFIYIFVANLSDFVVFNSQYSFKNLGNYIIGNKKRCINNLLVENKNSFNSEIEESIKGKKSKFNIVSVGRLDKLKNYPQSIKAISKLIYESIDIKLFIFGIGDQYQEIKNLAIELGIKKNIVFMNRVEEPFLYFEHFDLLLQTSKHESFPNSIVEALSENLYVVSTDVGDVQILLDNKRGSILKNDDPQIIADTIKEKIFDDNPQSLDGKNFIQDYLNNSKTINEWEKLILF